MLPKSYAHAARLPDGVDPVALDALVPGSGPVLLEIGSGRGMFALAYAATRPEQRVVALEIRQKYAALLDERAAARGLSNLRCFAHDARSALRRLQPDGSVGFVAVHFPDPWWKARHAKRMVVGDVLLDELARLVAPGGLVFVQTDVEHRAEEYVSRLTAHGAFENAAAAPDRFVAESPFAPARSNREARALADGLPFFRVLFRRRAAG